jgi:coproporphyrinogen III oxidase-like Fe-S oxidoreductase
VSIDNYDDWPYKKLEHWPPMTYRDRSPTNDEDLSSFKNLLNRDNQTKGNKELQPWIPFCIGRCAFCYFPVNCNKRIYDTYIKSLKKALKAYSESKYVKSSIFTELYVGGGSPSVLAENQIIDVLDFCRANFNLSKNCSTKFTACTTSLSNEKINLLAKHDITQLDIGIQTFNEDFRKILMLRDKGKKAQTKLKEVKKSGLGLSIDLLYNLPGQSLEQWEEDLKQALELEVESVDCYPLDLYTGTLLARKIASGELPPAGDYMKELQMYLTAYQLFRDNGYFPTCHNRFSRIKQDLEPPSVEVIGTGAGFFMGRIGAFQYSETEDVREYIAAVQRQDFPIARLSKLTKDEEMRQAMMMLYVRVSVNRNEFKTKFGKFPEEAFPKAFKTLRDKGLISEERDEIRLSEKGDPWRFNIAWEFFK